MNSRKPIPVGTQQKVLHEAGFRCANPGCRTILTLDLHHLEQVSEGGGNQEANLLALCPNCHRLHHSGTIPESSVRAWKFLLLSLNQGFSRGDVDTLLMLDAVKMLWVSSDRVIDLSSLLASGMIRLYEGNDHTPITHYHVALTEKGQNFVSGWKAGDQNLAIDGGHCTGDESLILPMMAEPFGGFERRSVHARAYLDRLQRRRPGDEPAGES